MSSPPARVLTGAIVYGLLVFLGTVVLGFVVLPVVAYASGLVPIETEAMAVFSLVTLKGVPFLACSSAAATLSYDWLRRLSAVRRVVVYTVTTVAVWMAGAAIAVLILG